MMHLGIVSDAHHYWDSSSRLCTLTPLARQFEQWASLFDQVTVVAPLLPGDPPAGSGPYQVQNIRLNPIPVAGGSTLTSKLILIRVLPRWWRVIQQLLGKVDAVHIRCPNNVGIPALLAVARISVPRQAAYTGTWVGYDGEPATYQWQRRYLARSFRGPVAVYGDWPNQPPHVVPSFSPSFYDADWEDEEQAVLRRIDRLKELARLPAPVRLLTVGSLTKNQDVVIRMVAHLCSQGFDVNLDVLGGGVQQTKLEALVNDLKLVNCVRIHGRVSHEMVRKSLRMADFVVQAPTVEGLGKVPIEAFFHGAVPILSNVNLSAQLVGGGERGRLFGPGDYEGAADAVAELICEPAKLASMIQQGRAYARTLTLERWREHLRQMLEKHWNLTLPCTLCRQAQIKRSPSKSGRP